MSRLAAAPRSLAVVLVATLSGCTGCEGGPGVAVFRPDGTPLERVASASASADDPAERPYELHLCPGQVETVIATLYTGCGGQCFEPSRVERVATSSRALHVALGPGPDAVEDELRFGHSLAVDAREPGGTVGLVLEASGPGGDYGAHAELLVLVDPCAP
jgi:hypothetical protein